MSYSTLLGIPESGPYESLQEFGNSWGSAARIWDAIANAYSDNPNWFSQSIASGSSPFWRLVDDPRLSDSDRLAFAFTFDGMICERERARDLAAALREFDRRHPRQEGYVNHLPAIADALEKHADDAAYLGFAFIQTSVSCDVWYVSEDCKDAFHESGDDDGYCPLCGGPKDEPQPSRPFAWDRDNGIGKHFMLFEQYGQTAAASAS